MDTQTYPQLKSRRGKSAKCKMPDGSVRQFTIDDDVQCEHDPTATKKVVLQRLKRDGGGQIELRLGYYLIGANASGEYLWRWNRYTAILPAATLVELYRQAERRGWFK